MSCTIKPIDSIFVVRCFTASSPVVQAVSPKAVAAKVAPRAVLRLIFMTSLSWCRRRDGGGFRVGSGGTSAGLANRQLGGHDDPVLREVGVGEHGRLLGGLATFDQFQQ